VPFGIVVLILTAVEKLQSTASNFCFAVLLGSILSDEVVHRFLESSPSDQLLAAVLTYVRLFLSSGMWVLEAVEIFWNPDRSNASDSLKHVLSF